ncbi:formylglycine-generating enzyme required for sulfatase activity [Runella defluvii]|uniref:Formylglycine-generating enzyme required for sulfatase activity n=1 Tax=Runella defluvii TaxID=370973 RepID=A0A7W5ZKS6_9BACT|nr:formylglycine-generating enzyme family protein [Runella defluvii]MBB3838674.1 formylglycine-generating enzyme required for sulfatase activity [Runella defluvii]
MKDYLQTFPDSPVAFTMIAIDGNMNGDPFKMSDTYRVRLSDFWMDQYPVTQALWEYVMRDTDMVNPSYFKGANRPVENVSWNDIDQLFLPRLNEDTKNNRPANTIYRLPTEAEWEYAARGGKYWDKYPFEYAGSNKLEEVGWYRKNSQNETQVVGLKTSNLLGLYDMSGNVWEWCSDWYDEDFYSSSTAKVSVNPTGPTMGSYRVNRGGGWSYYERNCRSTLRSNDWPGYRDDDVGLRLVLSFSVV